MGLTAWLGEAGKGTKMTLVVHNLVVHGQAAG